MSSKNLKVVERYSFCLEMDVLLMHLKISYIHVLVEDHLQLCPPLCNLYYENIAFFLI